MHRRLGIMQGRFTNKGGFFPQQFPWDSWKEEFFIAKEYGIDCIEWMFNSESYSENPIWTGYGRKEIKNIVATSGIAVNSICANIFMQNSIREESTRDIWKRLIEAGEELSVRQIIIPLFEASEIPDIEELYGILGEIKELIHGTGLCIGLESDLLIEQQRIICETLHSEQIGICYDVGNAAGKGYDCVKDVITIEKYLLELHLKDKPYQGTSVMLGEGAVNFRSVFEVLKNWKQNCFILESYFGKDAKNDTVRNIQYIQGVQGNG